MDRLSAPARLMVVSDLDFTMVDHHDSENLALLKFNALWESSYRHDSLLVFSTGRSPVLYDHLRKDKPLLTPDLCILSVGTEMISGDSLTTYDGWVENLSRNWDRTVVTEETKNFPELILQPESEQRPHKVSFRVEKEKAHEIIESVSERLKHRGLDVKLIYSGGEDVDVLPKAAGKGEALAFLLKKLKSVGKMPLNTLVCGDSGNDAELFTIPEVHGVVVGNAKEELLQWYENNGKNNPKLIHSSERCASGIIQAISHFGL